MASRIKFARKRGLAIGRALSSASGEEGAAILETALSITVFLTFLFGIFEAGFALYSYHFISEAAREGTRYASVRGNSWGTACAAYTSYECTASSTQIQSYVQNIGFPGINPSYMTVTPSWSAYSEGSSCPSSGACNSYGNLVTVNVTYNFPLIVPFIPAKTFALSSTSAMIISY